MPCILDDPEIRESFEDTETALLEVASRMKELVFNKKLEAYMDETCGEWDRFKDISSGVLEIINALEAFQESVVEKDDTVYLENNRFTQEGWRLVVDRVPPVSELADSAVSLDGILEYLSWRTNDPEGVRKAINVLVRQKLLEKRRFPIYVVEEEDGIEVEVEVIATCILLTRLGERCKNDPKFTYSPDLDVAKGNVIPISFANK